MKILSPAAAVKQEKLKSQLRSKRSIRAIDQGTFRDIPGQLRRVARSIEKGELGDVRDACLVVSTQTGNNNSPSITGFHYGTGSIADAHWMLSTLKNRLEPA